MAKRTQKQVIEIVKNNKYTVLSFNKETGRRESTYGGCDIITAMGEVVLKTSAGLDVLIFNGNDENLNLTRLEIQKGSRITYNEIKHLALQNNYSQPVRL